MPISSVLGSSALLPAGLGFRNKIINGDFSINQRGFSSSTTNGGYGFDRWLMSADAGATYSAQTFTVGNAISGYEPTNFARIVTSGQTGGNYAQFAQRIEDVRTFAGQSVSISFWAKAASGTPKVAIELQQNFGTGGSPSGTVLTYVSQVTLSTTWTRYVVQTIVPSISGKTLGSAGHYFSFAPFVSAGTGFESRTGSLGIQNNTFDFWGVQLEQNYQPTPFEQRPIGVEDFLCKRYYQVWSNSSNTSFMTIGNQIYSTPMSLSVPMRTITNTSTTFVATIYGQGTSYALNSLGVTVLDASRPQYFTLSGTFSGSWNYSWPLCTFNTHTCIFNAEL